MKTSRKLIVNILCAILYIFNVVCLFICHDELSNIEFMLFFMSHFQLVAALAYRKPDVTKSWFCRTFTLYVSVFTSIALLPVSGAWTLVPYLVTGFVHTMNLSYEETIGHHDTTEVSEGEKVKRMCYLWMAVSFLVTILSF